MSSKASPTRIGSAPAWQERAAAHAHWFLLAVIVPMPLAGLTWSLFGDRSVDVLGWFTIPAIGDVAWVAASAHFVHTWLGYATVAVVVAHVAGALKHHFVDRDRTLLRMVDGRAVASRSD